MAILTARRESGRIEERREMREKGIAPLSFQYLAEYMSHLEAETTWKGNKRGGIRRKMRRGGGEVGGDSETVMVANHPCFDQQTAEGWK